MMSPASDAPPVLDYDGSGVRRRLSLGRVVGAVVATLLLVSTLYNGVQAWRFHWTLSEQKAARPLSMVIDLSQPGVVHAPLTMGLPTLHGLSLHVATADPQRDAGVLLANLEGTLEFLDPQNGSVLFQTDLPNEHIDLNTGGSDNVLVGFARVDGPGTYTARMTVHSPAPATQGQKITLYARNEFCAAETVADFLVKTLTLASAVGFVVIGGLTFRGVRCNGWWRPIIPCSAPGT